MILNLVPVLFHLLSYQYLIFQLLVLIRRSLLQEAHSADTADVHDRCGRCIYPESTFCACLGSEGHSPLFLMKTLQSCKHQCAQSHYFAVSRLASWDRKAGSQQVKS